MLGRIFNQLGLLCRPPLPQSRGEEGPESHGLTTPSREPDPEPLEALRRMARRVVRTGVGGGASVEGMEVRGGGSASGIILMVIPDMSTGSWRNKNNHN